MSEVLQLAPKCGRTRTPPLRCSAVRGLGGAELLSTPCSALTAVQVLAALLEGVLKAGGLAHAAPVPQLSPLGGPLAPALPPPLRHVRHRLRPSLPALAAGGRVDAWTGSEVRWHGCVCVVRRRGGPTSIEGGIHRGGYGPPQAA